MIRFFSGFCNNFTQQNKPVSSLFLKLGCDCLLITGSPETKGDSMTQHNTKTTLNQEQTRTDETDQEQEWSAGFVASSGSGHRCVVTGYFKLIYTQPKHLSRLVLLCLYFFASRLNASLSQHDSVLKFFHTESWSHVISTRKGG